MLMIEYRSISTGKTVNILTHSKTQLTTSLQQPIPDLLRGDFKQ